MDETNPLGERENGTFKKLTNEIMASSFEDRRKALDFIKNIEIFKQENGFTWLYIRIPNNWRSNDESRRVLLSHLQQTQDKVIIESSPVLRAIFKTELTMRKSDPKRVLNKRE